MNPQDLYIELCEKTKVSFPIDEAGDNIEIGRRCTFNDIDVDLIDLLVPRDCKQRARRLVVSHQIIGVDVLSRFLSLFPNVIRFYFFNSRYEDPSFYKVFECRPVEELDLPLFVNDSVCFDSLSTLEKLESLHLYNLNSAAGLERVTPDLRRLTIHAPDLTMDQCMRFQELEHLDIFSGVIDPEADYPKLAKLPNLRSLAMPVYGGNFRHIPDLPKLEEFKFKSIPIRHEPVVAYMDDNIQYEDGCIADFPQLDSLRTLDLGNTGVSLQSFKEIIPKVPNITKLSIRGMAIKNGDDLLCMAQLTQLTECDLYGTKIKGSAMKKLAAELPNCEFEL